MEIIKTYDDVTRSTRKGTFGAYIDYNTHEFKGYVNGISSTLDNTTVIFEVQSGFKYRITLKNASTRFRVGTMPSYFWEHGEPVNNTAVNNLYIHPKDHNGTSKISEDIDYEIVIPRSDIYLAVHIWSANNATQAEWNQLYSTLKLERIHEKKDYSGDDFSIAPEVYIKNSDLSETLAVVDNYKSLIWTKRYYTAGEFELYMLADKKLLPYLKIDNVITRENDDRLMIIEKIEITTNASDGDFFIISGRSFESILSRRIVIDPLNINKSNPQSVIYDLIGYNMQGNTVRYLMDFVLSDNLLPLSNVVNGQYRGDNLLDTITAICKTYGIGIKMTEYEGKYMLECYQGKDTNVIFSKKLDNLISSSYVQDTKQYFNGAWVFGEGEGEARKNIFTFVDDKFVHDIKLRELFVDARDLSSKIRDDSGNETQMPEETYFSKLEQRGKEKLAEKGMEVTFTAEINYNIAFKYKVDYDLGDLVTVENGYGTTAHARIAEIVETWDENGYTCIPTFENWEVE